MRTAHKISVLLLALVLLVVLLLIPRPGHGQQQARDFGDYIVHYSAITTNQLLADIARNYGIERSAHRGLLNIAVQAKGDAQAHMINASVSAQVSDLTGHTTTIALRETTENGEVDYLGEFPLSGSGAYIFVVNVVAPGHHEPYVVKFNQDYVVD